MFEIEIRRTFAAAHQLKGYDGDCRNLHGHNYSVVVPHWQDSRKASAS